MCSLLSFFANMLTRTICFGGTGAREFLKFIRGSEVEDLSNSFMAGFGTGAWLCRLKGLSLCLALYQQEK